MKKPPRKKFDPRRPGESWSSFVKRWGEALLPWAGIVNVLLLT